MNITLPIKFLHELFTGDSPPHLAGVKPLTRAPGIHEDMFLIRWELGALIRQLDAEESFFHVEMFPSVEEANQGTPTSHAELYTAFVWQNSAAKVHCARTKLAKDNAPVKRNSTARQSAYAQIVKELGARKWPVSNCVSIAEILANNHGLPTPTGERLDLMQLAKAWRVDTILIELDKQILLDNNPPQ